MLFFLKHIYNFCSKKVSCLKNLNATSGVLSNYELAELNTYDSLSGIISVIIESDLNEKLFYDFEKFLSNRITILESIYNNEGSLSEYELGELNSFSNVLSLLNLKK